MDQVDYFNFIEDPDVNYFASFFKIREFKIQMIPGFIVILIVIAYVISDGYVLFHTFKKTNPVSFIIRSFIYIFGIPFLMIFNFSILFMNFKKNERKTFVHSKNDDYSIISLFIIHYCWYTRLNLVNLHQFVK